MLSIRKKNISKTKQERQSEQLSSFTIASTGNLKSIASSAQQCIWLDEQIYFNPSISPALYHILLPLRIKYGSMPIASIRSAIVATLEQQKIFRTALCFNEENGQLEQAVQPIIEDRNYSFQVTYGAKTHEEIDALLVTEFNTHFAQLDRGLVVRCHLIKMDVDDMEILYADDIIIFVFHHIAFDLSSIGSFVDAFSQAYNLAEPFGSTLQYIDYALYEHTLLVDPRQDSKINQARRFWSMFMNGYDWNKKYQLLIDSKRNTKIRTGRGHAISFFLDSNLVHAQVQCAMLNNVSMFQLGLTCFFAFLYKLCISNEDDFCVTSPTDNRLLPETKTMIGMFVNLLPYRTKINPAESFITLMLRVRQLCIDVLEHAQLPYQEIIGSVNKPSSSRIPFNFQYESTMSLITAGSGRELKTKDAILGGYPGRDWSKGNGTALHDLSLTMTHNLNDRTTHFIIEYSTDLYEEPKISLMARRFQHFLAQIFSGSAEKIHLNQNFEPVSKFSLLLPEDVEEIQRIIFHRLPNIVQTGMNFVEFLSYFPLKED